jgi:hypothetical protein
MKEQHSSDKLLVLWENRGVGGRRAAEAVRYLRRFYTIRLCVLEEEAPGPEKDGLYGMSLGPGRPAEDAQDLLADIETVFVPMVSDSLLQSLEEGTMESPFAAVVMTALCSGIPVYSLSSAREGKSAGCRVAVAYQEKRRQLFTDCGIKILTTGEEDNETGGFQKEDILGHRIFTEEDILRLAKENRRRIALRRGEHITPLAADTAKDLGIEVLYSNYETK